MLCGNLNMKDIYKSVGTCIHVADSLWYTAETNKTL